MYTLPKVMLAIAGTAALSATVNAGAAQAVTLTPTTDVTDWNKQWVVEGRAGQAGTSGSYEFAIGPSGASADNTGEIQYAWGNNQPVSWDLTWDGTTAAFTVAGQTISYTPGLSGIIDALTINTKVITPSKNIAPGTEMFFQIDQVNGSAIAPVSSLSVGPQNGSDFNEFAFLSDSAITSLSGSATMSWLSGNPTSQGQSRVAFQLKGYDAPNLDPEPVPEPSLLLGLLAAAGFGALQQRRRAV
ncbi:MAG: choice-of-anchor W domain-containing protein [Cyanobacteria bacterium P01_H01_bin.119]